MIEELISIHLNHCEACSAAELLHSASKYIHRLERICLVLLLVEIGLPMSLEELDRRVLGEGCGYVKELWAMSVDSHNHQ